MMKSEPIERMRENLKTRRDQRFNDLKNPEAKSEKPTHFEIGGETFELNKVGFSKAVAQGILLIIGFGLGFGSIMYGLYVLFNG